MKYYSLCVVLVVINVSVHAQSTGDVLKQAAGNGVKSGAAVATEKTADKVTDKVLGKLFNKKKKNAVDTAKSVTPVVNSAAPGTSGSASATGSAGNQGGPSSASLKTYSKFDFEPGEKILNVEDFSQDAQGDFPAKWNTNSTGEIQTIEGRPGKWLSISKKGMFYPEYINNLPDNFTYQFDLICSDNYSFYSSNLHMEFAALKTPAKDFTHMGVEVPKNCVDVQLHPQDANAEVGHTTLQIFSDNNKTIQNDENTIQWVSKNPAKRSVKVSVWRQKQRLRVYLNEEKVWDIPRAFDADKKYNTIMFALDDARPGGMYLLSNMRLAVGTPDTRNKLMTEGKFSTTGILFDVNSATIKPESYGVLKDIASVLTENSAVRVKITGHTDSDGDAALNLSLSKKRADAVKDALSKEFGIDASRMDTDGKGSTQPSAPNTTPEGKAQNRRVEFLKL
jgi:OOP family OmpA-OmpF porin